MIRFIFLLLLIVDAISCWSGQLPFFTGLVEPGNEENNEYLAEYGGQLECRFKHEPLRYSTAQDGSYFVIFDSTNMTNSSEIEKLSLRFNRVEQTPITRKVMLLESSLKADKTTFPIPGANRYVYAYKVEGAITIYSLDLLKSQTYSCCVESRENSTTGSICAYLKFKQDRTDQKNEEDEQSDEVAIDTTTPSTSELDFIARNNTLYKVIMILLVSIFVLLLVMFALCLRFSLDDGSLSYRGRRSHRTTTVRSPTSPQLFTVSVPGQASMPKLSIARGDLYSRYNLNNTSVSIVDEPQAAVRTLSDECLPPPPPYAELAAFQKSRSLSG